MNAISPIFPRRFRPRFGARPLLSMIVVAIALFGLSPAVLAADMAEVHKAINEDRLFDAFRELADLAKEGNPEAQYELAGFYHWGRVGAANFPKARDWYQRSANQGNVDAMIGLAVMNGYGQGGPVDKRTAVKWLMIASDSQKLSQGDAAKIAQKRDQLAQDLSPADLATATAEAHAFQPKLEN